MSSSAQSFAAKLVPKYSGPYTIVKILTPVRYELEDPSSRKNPKVHVKDLKLCNPSADHPDDAEIAPPPTSPAPGPSKQVRDRPQRKDLRSQK